MTHRILVIEDDTNIATVVSMHLRDNGNIVTIEPSGDSGLEKFENEEFDLIVLDLMLPEIDGLTICKRIRAKNSYVPILMLTAKSSELDRVLGLELGADDYLTKPFSIPEFIARVKALLRRAASMSRDEKSALTNTIIETHGLTINIQKRLVEQDGHPIDLTAKEFDLLLHFARNPGRVYNRSELLEQIWGYNYEGYEHTINTHINRLRAKIEEDPRAPTIIETVWSVGYKMAEG